MQSSPAKENARRITAPGASTKSIGKTDRRLGLAEFRLAGAEEAEASEEERQGARNRDRRHNDVAFFGKAQVVDGETSRLGANEVKENASNLGCAALRDEAEELDAGDAVNDGTEGVAVAVEGRDAGRTDSIEEASVKTDAGDVDAEQDGDRAVEGRATRQDRRCRVGAILRDERVRRRGVEAQRAGRRADDTGRGGSARAVDAGVCRQRLSGEEPSNVTTGELASPP